MKALCLIFFIQLAIVPWTTGYNIYHNEYAPSYMTAAPNMVYTGCCEIDFWSQQYKDEVGQFVERLRQEYTSMAGGRRTEYLNTNKTPWKANIIQLTGKTASELDALAHSLTEQFIIDLRKETLKYEIFRNVNFFEWLAGQALRKYSRMAEDLGQQTQQNVDFGQYAYPAEIQYIQNIPYTVHTSNYTKYSKKYGDSVVQQNRNVPTRIPPMTLRDWYQKEIEPEVADYQPVWNPSSRNMLIDQGYNHEAEMISSGNNFRPVSTVTVHGYNKTRITNSDGTNREYGSEMGRKWVDGKLVYDVERPFGEWTVPLDETWKSTERERLFWMLTPGSATTERLEAWQRQQEERLTGLAERYNISLDDIYAWHRSELERYLKNLGQYQSQTTDLNSWQRAERGRLDWLIHHNRISREEMARWQNENSEKLKKLAAQYRISYAELLNWQLQELNRLYTYFNNQNNAMVSRPFNAESLRVSEQSRLDELIRQHNATIEELHNSIKLDQQKLANLSMKYRGNVQEMEKWLQTELSRLKGVLSEQHNEMQRINGWQSTERGRLENILKQHRGDVAQLQNQMALDRNYMQSLASKYKVTIEELQNWQSAELNRLQKEGNEQLDMELKEWQRREREHLKLLVQKNDLTVEELQAVIINDRTRLQHLANTYKIQVSEIEDWIRQEIKNFQSDGLVKQIKKELEVWQQQERERLLSIVSKNTLTVEQFEEKIKNDRAHLFAVANNYQVGVEEVENWLKQELLRLRSEGLVKVEDLQEWQREQREDILKIVQQNKLTIEEFERKLLSDRERLANLARTYNVKTSEIESWIKNEGERLQNIGMLQMREELNNWQKIERDRIFNLINKNNISIEELETKINKDQEHIYGLAQKHQVHVEEIEDWIRKEIKKLQQEGVIEMEKLKDWQTEWRGNLTNMIRERDFTVEEFHKWLLEDRARLNDLALQHNLQIEEIEQWIHNEENRFVSMGLLKPNEKLTTWQEVERRYLERITQDQYHSTEQLEQRLRQDRELLQELAQQYSIQVEEVEDWMKKELARLRDEGQLQIDNLAAWQIAERERLELLAKQNTQWSVEEFEAELRKDREHMQLTAFQYHTSVEEIEKWLKSEVYRLQSQGKLNIENLSAWQKEERKRILQLLQLKSNETVEEFEERISKDRRFILNLAKEHQVDINNIEAYVKQVIEDLREKGKFELEKLQVWQKVEREYIQQIINEYKNALTTAQYEQLLLNDRTHLEQLSQQYHMNIEQIEKFMVAELRRLRQNSEQEVQKLAAWQRSEAQRLKELIKKNNNITYVGFELELLKERARLLQLAKDYEISVEEVENFLRENLLNLKTSGEINVENLTQWQKIEQKRLIDMLLQEQKSITEEELEYQLRRDQNYLQQLARNYSVNIDKVKNWMRDEVHRLNSSGLLQVENLEQWQKYERDRLQNWLNQQNHVATSEDFSNFIRRDNERLENIARDYHITVEEVETWVKEEGTRLQILGQIQRPQSLVATEDFISSWHTNENTNLWKQRTRDFLKSYIDIGDVNSLASFENFLAQKQTRLRHFALEYHTTVEEIEAWLRQEAQELARQGQILGEITQEEWEIKESEHIQNLINKRLRKQQQWSIEELERKLYNDNERLHQISTQYHKTLEEINDWYKEELKRLLLQQTIVSEDLKDWQRREKDRLYKIVTNQRSLTVENLKNAVLKDRNTLNQLADSYNINVEILEYWIRNEINRLRDLGLVQETSATNLWLEEERKRLRDIAAEIMITEEEFLEYIAGDFQFQQDLANFYRISQEALAPVQRVELIKMQGEGVLDATKLIMLQDWQKIERDRLYNFIKTMNFSQKNLENWQRQDMLLNEFAAKYGIGVQELKNWQLNEFKRLQRIADYYKMTLSQLQNFREQELNNINFVMHKKFRTEAQRVSWLNSEAKRIAALARQTGLNSSKLLVWRRTLYLLSQGLIPLNFGEYGGHEIGVGSTNRTGIPRQEISMDRGDQPPVVYEEEMDPDEPGLATEPHLPLAPIREELPPVVPVQYPENINMPAQRISSQSGYRYSKIKTKMTVPVANASASAFAGNGESSARASAYASRSARNSNSQYNGRQSAVPLVNDGGQQQQQEEISDFGQQVQVQETEYLQQDQLQQQQQQEEDFGQQQVQVEQVDIPLNSLPNKASSNNKNDAPQKQVEVQAKPEEPGVFSKILNVFG